MSGIMSGAPAMPASMAMGQSFGSQGGMSRTRSFPDLMLSTGDYPLVFPPPPGAEQPQAGPRGGILKPPPHRQNSGDSDSMASATRIGFHPVRSRTNTAMSGLNDAMSVMSIDLKSEESSWLDNFRSMRSVHSDAGNSLKLGDEASVRSLLSDMSNDLNALDLAEPLLPPYQGEYDMNGSDGLMPGIRPDP